VTFSLDPATTPAACTLNRDHTIVTFRHVGTCVIDADQQGDTDYNKAPTVQQIVTVPLADQTITFTSAAPTDALVDETYTVAATGGGSGQPVTFGSATPAVCTVSGSTVTFVGVGTCMVTADQAGNKDYNAALTATQNVAVTAGVDIRVEATAGLFPNSVLVTVYGDPAGKSTFLEVSSDPPASGLTLGDGCVRLGQLGRCTITKDKQQFLFFVPPPAGGRVTLTFHALPLADIGDPRPANNVASYVIGP
jgi:hypothetical protein